MPSAQMPVNGHTYTVNLPQNFMSLPSDAQKSVLETAHESILSMQAQQNDSQSAFSGLGDAVQAGAHSALQGIANTAGMFAGDLSQSHPTVAKYLNDVKSAASSVDPGAPANYTGSGIEQDWNTGNYGHLISDLPRAIAEQAPNLAGNLGAAAVGEAVGGPVGAAAGLVGYNTATSAGDNAMARAQANGDATPTASDQVIGTGLAVGQGLLQDVGLGRIPGVGRAVGALPGLVRPAANAALEGATGAANNVVQQAGTTAGTQQGMQIDPGQVANAGLSAAGARLAQSAPTEAAVGAGQSALAGKTDISGMSQDEQDSASRVANLIDALKPAMGRSAKPTTIFATARDQIRTQLDQGFKALKKQGAITPEEYNTIAAPIVNAAGRNTQTLLSGDKGFQTAWDKLQQLNLPPEQLANVRNSLMDLNTLSTAALQKNQTGPLQQIGQKLGGVVGTGAMFMAHPGGALTDIIAGRTFSHPIGHVLGAMGSVGDRLLGLQEPPVVQQARAIAQARGKGNIPTSNSLQNVEAFSKFASNPGEVQDVAATRAKQAFAQRAMNNLANNLATYGPDDPVGAQAMEQLHALNRPDLVQGALHGFQLSQPMRAANFAAAPQRMADKAAMRNQTVLDAADTTPNPPHPVGLTATNAAVNQLGSAARKVQRQGGEMGEDGEPIEVSQAQRRYQAKKATQGASSGPQSGSKGGWRSYVQSGLLAANIPHTHADIDAAVGDLKGSSYLNNATADWLLLHDEALRGQHGRNTLAAIQNRVAVRKGYPEQFSDPYANDSGPIRNRSQWNGGKDFNQEVYKQQEARFQAENMPRLAEATQLLSQPTSKADREQIRNALTPEEQAILRARLGPKLFKQ